MDDDVPASLAAASSLVRRVWMGEARGYGVVAARALAEGERLFEEYPLIAMQHEANRAAGVQVCERCFAFLGPLEAQVGGLLRARGVALDVLPDKLPAVDGLPPLPTPVPCPGGCSLRFCSEACARATFGEHHRLLCPCLIGNSGMESEPAAPTSKRGRPDAALLRVGIARIEPPLEDALDTMRLSEVGGSSSAAAAAASSSAAAASGSLAAASGSSAAAIDVGDGGDAAAAEAGGSPGLTNLPSEPLPRFEAHAKQTNEIFLLAAKAVAGVLCKLEGMPAGAARDAAYAVAVAPYDGPLWWDAVATPDDVDDEGAFKRTLRALVTESWALLASVLGPVAPADCPLFASADAYARIVGAFERRNCAVQVASPVEAYLLAVDALPDGAHKASVSALTTPLLDALDEAYATPCDGTGLFPAQATLNHSCVPNVSLVKEEDSAEERDGRVVARTTRAVAEGEELCNPYVDVSLPLRRRRRELREYGFECDCPRCVQELAAAAEKKAADKKAGKKRLK